MTVHTQNYMVQAIVIPDSSGSPLLRSQPVQFTYKELLHRPDDITEKRCWDGIECVNNDTV